MTRYEKLLHRIRNNPHDVRTDELLSVLRWAGVNVRRTSAGSHAALSRGTVHLMIALPHGAGRVKVCYVIDALKTFDLWEGASMRTVTVMPKVDLAEVRRLASQRYCIEMWPCEEGGWFVKVPDLPGCMSQGETPEEAIFMIEDAKLGWIEMVLEDGQEVPPPRNEYDFSGRFVVRVPSGIHRELVNAARREDASLNQFVNAALAKELGRLEAGAPSAAAQLASADRPRPAKPR